MKIYTSMAGGLGDIVLWALADGHDLGYFDSLKAAHPEAETRAHLWMVTDTARELLVGMPCLDGAEFHDFDKFWESRSWEIACQGGYRQLTDEERDALEWRRPEFVLNGAEREHAANILAHGPFAALHPFAGDQIRDFRANGLGPETCARTMCEAGVRVLLLGGGSRRQTAPGEFSDLIDEFNFEHENLVDLRGEGVRLQAWLVGKASAFIGSTSAFNCVAEVYGIPTLAFTSKYNRKCIQRHSGGIFYLMRKRGTLVYYFDRMPGDPCAVIRDFALRTVVG